MGKNLAFTCADFFVQIWQWKVALILFYLYSNKSKLQIDLSDSDLQGKRRKKKVLEKGNRRKRQLGLKEGKNPKKFLWTSDFFFFGCYLQFLIVF